MKAFWVREEASHVSSRRKFLCDPLCFEDGAQLLIEIKKVRGTCTHSVRVQVRKTTAPESQNAS